MKIKVSAATTLQLDWLVSKCEGLAVGERATKWRGENCPHLYSTDWSKGGPLVQRHISELSEDPENGWTACCNGTWAAGYTALEAICRAYVASKLGEEVEVPEELT